MKRKNNESFNKYKIRRKLTNLLLERRLEGRVWWDSLRLGTFKKSIVK